MTPFLDTIWRKYLEGDVPPMKYARWLAKWSTAELMEIPFDSWFMGHISGLYGVPAIAHTVRLFFSGGPTNPASTACSICLICEINLLPPWMPCALDDEGFIYYELQNSSTPRWDMAEWCETHPFQSSFASGSATRGRHICFWCWIIIQCIELTIVCVV